MTENKTLRVKSDRLWSRLMQMAEIGSTANGGCNRQALTDLDRQGRTLLLQWCSDAGCHAQWDEIGNLFIRRQGVNNSLGAVVTGSHLDTQPTGGKFDGVYGVLAGLEVIETLNDHNIQTERPIDLVVWTNEEGARFSPAMMGSGVFCGALNLQEMLSVKDKEGVTVAQALTETGYANGSFQTKDYEIYAAFEVHIEQGPILEQQQKQIGVVSGIQGIRWYDLTVTGEPVHAGPTPMTSRQDSVKGAIQIMDALYKLVEERAPSARITFGDLKAQPGSRNTVPKTVSIAIDLRHPNEVQLNDMDQQLRSLVKHVCEQEKLAFEIETIWHFKAIEFSKRCITAVEHSVKQLGYSHMDIVSGAGHDSGYLSQVAPTSMIFIPCKDGISHNEAESAKPEDITAGCNVLLHAMLSAANS